MAIFSNGNSMLWVKALLVSTGVLSTAVMLKLWVPVIMGLASSEVPSIWSFVVSCLRPPYLFLLINFIIITIVASTKLQPKVDALLFQPEPIKAPAYVRTDFTLVYGSVDFKNEVSHPVFEKVSKVSEYDVSFDGMKPTDVYANSKSSWPPDPTNYSLSPHKPPVSSRFSHRKSIKASPEGGRTLGVAKAKRQETLESTWKTITDGRPMPLTRHLKKSDTWETHNRPKEHPHPKMGKSESFTERKNSSLSGSPKLRKEGSLSQEELNKRVEAFINKFNEDMRLQRQESLNQYMEMINRGAHYPF